MTAVGALPSRDAGRVVVVVDTPRGSRNKYRYDERREIFELSHVLPAGAVFPFDFGWVPQTRTGDGDPIDVLLLLDAPAFPGCVVPTRLVGVLEAEQGTDDRWQRNDRLIGVAEASTTRQHVRALADLDPHLVRELEHFFISYNAMRHREFRVIGLGGPQRADSLLAEAERARQPAQRGSRRSASRTRAPARRRRPRSKRKIFTTPRRRRPTAGANRTEGSTTMAAAKRSSSKSSSRKTASKSTSGRAYGKKASSKVGKAMHERKEGTLRSGSGKKVTSRKQAIAIGLSEARKSGAKVPSKSKK